MQKWSWYQYLEAKIQIFKFFKDCLFLSSKHRLHNFLCFFWELWDLSIDELEDFSLEVLCPDIDKYLSWLVQFLLACKASTCCHNLTSNLDVRDLLAHLAKASLKNRKGCLHDLEVLQGWSCSYSHKIVT